MPPDHPRADDVTPELAALPAERGLLAQLCAAGRRSPAGWPRGTGGGREASRKHAIRILRIIRPRAVMPLDRFPRRAGILHVIAGHPGWA